MTDATAIPAELPGRLAQFVKDQIGHGSAVSRLEPMIGGHAGLTFGFRAETPDRTPRDLILKLAPPGVRREGNTDVYRQAPLLRALHALGLPVPAVPFASPDDDVFGVPFVIMERLQGREFFIWDPHSSFSRAPEAVAPLWRQVAEALPKFHAPDVTRALAEWEAPRPLETEINRWRPIYAKAPEESWAATADRLRLRLLDTMPAEPPVGLIHGDYQPGNGLFADGRLTGMIDWELSGIGAHRLDIGWLMMCADPESWIDEARPVNAPPPAELLGIYEAGIGRPVKDIAWYQALAGYRLGAITCLNVYLHRSGKRVDAVWDRFGRNTATFFARAEALLGA